jgi:SAM-dependent methyltransferase
MGAGPGTSTAVLPRQPSCDAGSEPRWERRWEPRWPPRSQPLPEAYLALAQDYQRRAELFTGWRELLVARLGAHRADTVVDVGCGPGLNFAALRAAVGPQGTIIAIEESPELLAVAAHRVARRGWENIELINASARTARLSVRADGALLCAAQDVLASPSAMGNLFSQLRPGAAVAAGGWKQPPVWLWPIRACIPVPRGASATDFTSSAQPWQLMSEHVPDLHVTQLGFGTAYLAHGHTARPTTDPDTATTGYGS